MTAVYVTIQSNYPCPPNILVSAAFRLHLFCWLGKGEHTALFAHVFNFQLPSLCFSSREVQTTRPAGSLLDIKLKGFSPLSAEISTKAIFLVEFQNHNRFSSIVQPHIRAALNTLCPSFREELGIMYYLQGHHTARWQKFRPFRTHNKRDHLTLGCIILSPRARPCLRLPFCTTKRRISLWNWTILLETLLKMHSKCVDSLLCQHIY